MQKSTRWLNILNFTWIFPSRDTKFYAKYIRRKQMLFWFEFQRACWKSFRCTSLRIREVPFPLQFSCKSMCHLSTRIENVEEWFKFCFISDFQFLYKIHFLAHIKFISDSCRLSTFEKMPSLSFRLFLGKNHRETFYIYYHKKTAWNRRFINFLFYDTWENWEFRHFSYRSKNDDSLQKTHFNDDDDVVQVFNFLKTLKTQT